MKRLLPIMIFGTALICLLALTCAAERVPYRPKCCTESSTIYIDGDFAYGLVPKTTVSALKKQFISDIRVIDKDGNALTNTSLVGSGAKVYNSQGTLLMTFVLEGDINGNGKIETNDALILRGMILNTDLAKPYPSGSAGFIAADLNRNNRRDSNDLIWIRAAILGIKASVSRPRPSVIEAEAEDVILPKSGNYGQLAITAYSEDAQAAYNGFASRAKTALTRYYNKPVVKGDTEAWAMAANALVRFGLNKELDTANAQLIALCTTYPPTDQILSPYDSYFTMNMILRCYFQYGELLTDSAKSAVVTYFRQFLNLHSSITRASERPTDTSYQIWDSENHNMVQCTTSYLGSYLLMQVGYGSEKLSDGKMVSEHHTAWAGYLEAYLTVRGRYGVNIESGSPTYYKYCCDCFLSLYDFSPEDTVKELARKTLDVMMAESVLQTSLNARGDATVRTYKDSSASPTGATEYYMAAFFGQNWTAFKSISFHPAILSSVLTTYRPATYLYDLYAADLTKTPYLYRQYMPSAGTRQYLNGSRFLMTMSPDKNQSLKTTYVCSEYVLGSITSSRKTSATPRTEIFTQNACFKVVFSTPFTSNYDNRLTFVGATSNTTGYNELDGITAANAMIVAHAESTDTKDFAMVYSNAITWTKSNGWLVAKEPTTGAYVAVYSVGGLPTAFTSTSDIKAVKSGFASIYTCNDSVKMMIVQCAPSGSYASLEAFTAAVTANTVSYDASAKTVTYTTLDKDTLVYSSSRSTDPSVNGETVSFAPAYLYQSPYLNASYGSGITVITDSKGNQFGIDFTGKHEQ